MIDFIEEQFEKGSPLDEKILEIKNIENTMLFIDDNIKKEQIKKLFVSELHKRIVNNLTPFSKW